MNTILDTLQRTNIIVTIYSFFAHQLLPIIMNQIAAFSNFSCLEFYAKLSTLNLFLIDYSSVCLSIYGSVCVWISLCMDQSMHQSMHQSIHQSIHQSMHRSFYVWICLCPHQSMALIAYHMIIMNKNDTHYMLGFLFAE